MQTKTYTTKTHISYNPQVNGLHEIKRRARQIAKGSLTVSNGLYVVKQLITKELIAKELPYVTQPSASPEDYAISNMRAAGVFTINHIEQLLLAGGHIPTEGSDITHAAKSLIARLKRRGLVTYNLHTRLWCWLEPKTPPDHLQPSDLWLIPKELIDG
jgi:hypothetical protein